jgi:hypothetical protein
VKNDRKGVQRSCTPFLFIASIILHLSLIPFAYHLKLNMKKRRPIEPVSVHDDICAPVVLQKTGGAKNHMHESG